MVCWIGLVLWLSLGLHKAPVTPQGGPPVATYGKYPGVAPVHPSIPPNVILSKDWDEVRAVRETTLKSHPDLASEYQQLKADMVRQETELNAAMIKSDPKVAPILAKVEQLRKQTEAGSPQSSSSPSTKATPAKQISLSANDWQELRVTRSAALKADPDLPQQTSQLREKVYHFEQKLSAAMLEADPKIAPLLASFSSDWKPAEFPVPPNDANK